MRRLFAYRITRLANFKRAADENRLGVYRVNRRNKCKGHEGFYFTFIIEMALKFDPVT